MKNCNNCRYDHGSYHCLDCDTFDGDGKDLMPFCSYCNNNNCGNCVWEDY